MLVEEGSLDDLMAAAASLVPSESKNIISDACVRAVASIGVSIAERNDFNELGRTPFVAAVETVSTWASKPLNAPIDLWPIGRYNLSVFQSQLA